MTASTSARAAASHVIDDVAFHLGVPPAESGAYWLHVNGWTLQVSPVAVTQHEQGLMWCAWKHGDLAPMMQGAAPTSQAGKAVADLVAWGRSVQRRAGDDQ